MAIPSVPKNKQRLLLLADDLMVATFRQKLLRISYELPRAKARSLVRIAYKAFEIGLPFDDSSIDPGSEVLYRSHTAKVDEMKDWADSPFANMRLEQAENEGYAFWLKERDGTGSNV
jgi:hypothetical protein